MITTRPQSMPKAAQERRQPPELLKLSARLDQLEHTTALLLQQLQESRQQLKESKLAGNMYIFRHCRMM
ncbi:hypothetical protein WJX79_004278 [Trebouxia sp. C0005]